MSDARPLNILHVFRAPLGGLFRHVADLVQGQIERGHRVGIIADRTQYGPHPEGILADLKDRLALGFTRIAIGREIGPGDIAAAIHISRRIADADADVVHGHGAKGGAFARLSAPRHRAVRVYTPHGGSLLYRPGTLASRFYIMLEQALKSRTDLFLFESAFIGRLYTRLVGEPKTLTRVVNNGVGEKEFVDITPHQDATDILFIGELRPIKGVDVLIDAIADIRNSGLPLTATIVGDGRSRAALQAQVKNLGLSDVITFHAPIPAREAFARGRLAVVPSRAESMPYIVLELAAAQVPLISTNVGGIPDIFGDQAGLLINPDDKPALIAAITRAVKNPETMRPLSQALRDRVRAAFSIDNMVEGVLAGYRDALKARHS
jgi:glycosyltransferase involved in cell wall biosynthesis